MLLLYGKFVMEILFKLYCNFVSKWTNHAVTAIGTNNDTKRDKHKIAREQQKQIVPIYTNVWTLFYAIKMLN